MSKRRNRKKLPQETPSVKIENLSHAGKGIVKINEKVVFVAGALPEETVTIKYTKIKRSYDEASVIEINKKSKFRIIPQCQYFMLCGGCSLQHLSSEKQIEFKLRYLLDQFQKIAKFTPNIILKSITGETFGYRRKARLGVRLVPKKGGALVGFRELNSKFLAVMDSCEVLHPKIGHKIHKLKSLINQMDIGNKIAQIEVAMGDEDCVLIFRNLIDLTYSDIKLLDQFGKVNQFYIYVQSGGIDTIGPLNKNHKIILKYRMDDLNFEFKPHNFTQINSKINQKMVKRALNLLDIHSDENILDLFCGLGNFTLAIAQYANQVLGLEGSTSLVQDAYHNAKINHIKNVEFAILDLQTDLLQGSWLQKKWHKVLLDPPRNGAIEILPTIAKLNPEKIVYISCNPVTLARDTDILVNKFGYTCEQAGVIDMFPHTSHVESIALFIKNNYL